MDPVDLIILGGGASGTAMLQALAARTEATPLRVVLVERSERLGPGLPYRETAEPFHTMGRTATLRHEKGAQLTERFQLATERLRRAGVSVEIRKDTEALGLAREGAGWRVETTGGEVVGRNVVVATGHWHVGRLAHVRRWVDWRWDVRRLVAEIADDEDVIVLGMGQSGLDAAVSLAERRSGRAGAGKVQLASRLGLLPAVYGHVSGASAPRATRHLRALLESPKVTLAEIVAAAHADAESLAGSERVPPWTPEALRAHAAIEDGVALFRGELARAQASKDARVEIPWHPVLWHGMHAFHELMPRLSAEDRLRLAANWTPIMRHVEAIHVGAARRLLGFIDQGLIRVTALGESPRVFEDARAVFAQGSRGSVEGARIIDARGPDPRLALSDDRFLHALLATGAAVPGRVAFEEGAHLAWPSPRAGASRASGS